MDLSKLTDADIRQLTDDGIQIIEPITHIVATGINGTYPCPHCQFDAAWSRDGENWRIDCDCGWNAAGFLGRRAPLLLKS